MDAAEILLASGVALAGAIRERRTTSVEVVRAHIARARAVNPGLNAIVRDRYEEALREAARADERVAGARAEELPPFHGVPVSIKEAYALEGMPNTSGLWARRDVVARDDATVVRRLREAGAIPIGVTNTSELCMWFESANKVWGRTNNAYDPARTCGGSSGGEGAIVGAGAVPFGLGSDVGGSIRMPAFFNGVFGHKPTGGLVPSTGHHPPAKNEVQRFVCCGPLARRAADLMPCLRAIAGPDGVEERTVEHPLGDPADVDLRRLTIYSIERGPAPVQPELLAAQRRAAAALEARGARVERREIPALRRSLEIWSAMMHVGSEGANRFRDLMSEGGDLRPWRELARSAVGRSRFTVPGLLLSVLEDLPGLLPGRMETIVGLGHELERELASLLGDRGALLYPSFPRVAPRHRTPLLRPFQFAYTAIFNVMQMPSTQVPLGLDPQGVPVGVQVAAPRFADHVTIAIAIALEDSLGGWSPPSRFAR
ncbi:MAG: amidase [Deltaproteobacteria bacterium]|nr:amidase [Deltaproteobacteria bacterium]